MTARSGTQLVDLVVTGAAELLTCAGGAPDLVGRHPRGGGAKGGGARTARGGVGGESGRREIDAPTQG
ncbi:hypothetical protein, partial [Arthrobacter sp.]|uniref:hypothetical protein n=1 Tax=Arthrobacter sp. TaxID=1667 RepID=UPI002584940A